MSEAPLVELRGVVKAYANVRAVDGIDLDVAAGEIFGIIGSSGAGKSTLVRLINGLEAVTAGTVRVGGNQVSGVSESRLREIRTGIGMIFQQFNLFRSRTVAGNVDYPLRVAGWDAVRRRKRVAELLGFVGLETLGNAYPEQLSGGQKQRVGIARALATSPKLLLADEATSALDPETTADVLRLLRRVNRELGVTIVVITHEMDVVRSICDRVAVLAKGRVVELGSVFDVFTAPQSDIARSFVSTVLRNRPSTDEVARLRDRHAGVLVTVEQRELEGGTTLGAVLGRASELGVEFDIVYGGISELQNRPFGSITLQLQGVPRAVDELIGQLALDREVEVH